MWARMCHVGSSEKNRQLKVSTQISTNYRQLADACEGIEVMGKVSLKFNCLVELKIERTVEVDEEIAMDDTKWGPAESQLRASIVKEFADAGFSGARVYRDLIRVKD